MFSYFKMPALSFPDYKKAWDALTNFTEEFGKLMMRPGSLHTMLVLTNLVLQMRVAGASRDKDEGICVIDENGNNIIVNARDVHGLVKKLIDKCGVHRSGASCPEEPVRFFKRCDNIFSGLVEAGINRDYAMDPKVLSELDKHCFSYYKDYLIGVGSVLGFVLGVVGIYLAKDQIKRCLDKLCCVRRPNPYLDDEYQDLEDQISAEATNKQLAKRCC